MMKETCWLSRWAIVDAPSVMTCKFEDHFKVIYPDRNIVLSILIWSIIIIYGHNDNVMFRQSKNVGHCYGPLLMVSLLWLVVIDHIIFPMRRFCVCYLFIEVKDWLFDIFNGPPDLSYMKTFIGFFLSLQSKTALMVAYMNYTKFHLFFIQSIFIH